MPDSDLPVHPHEHHYQPTVVPSISAQELFEAFLSDKSPKTIAAYRRDLEDFSQFLGSTDISETIRRFCGQGLHQANHLALTYKNYLVDKNLQPTTVNRKLASLRSLTDMAYTLGMITWRVRVKNQKVSSSLRSKLHFMVSMPYRR